MIFIETKLKGAFMIIPEFLEDERGFFARTYCYREFEKRGLDPNLVQCNISYNKKKGTLRGMHYQAAPHEEAKLVRCIRGSMFDAVIDLRPNSTTYCQWLGIELKASTSQITAQHLQHTDHYKMLYIPKGFAHGFQTLEDDTEVFYQMSEFYHAEYVRGIRWDDPGFGILWPYYNPIVSTRDQRFPEFKP